MKQKLPERRRFVRAEEPLRAVIKQEESVVEATTNNLSPMGLNLETRGKFNIAKELDVVLFLPEEYGAVHLDARVIWCRKATLEDEAPHTTGVEILEVKNEDKNPFLKYMCDMMYALESSIQT